MVNARAKNNSKKRSATTKIQGKPSKSLKKADPVEEVIHDLDLLHFTHVVAHVKYPFEID